MAVLRRSRRRRPPARCISTEYMLHVYTIASGRSSRSSAFTSLLQVPRELVPVGSPLFRFRQSGDQISKQFAVRLCSVKGKSLRGMSHCITGAQV